ncbi:hypothetical protein ZIOFF_048390 [Zingiber officinale]|uniref:PDZ domain-containing protein n=1 Tax=Zingiber officinale TaxID=94328 RepID=A0A8J5FZQ9_ZINOF|nr:hypothetical protein ZIOFF_048390 [Zingiber officinale]
MHVQGRRWSGDMGGRFSPKKGMAFEGSIFDAGPIVESYGVAHGYAAVMLEQASYCYLLSIPPMLRKYGFHLVLSGNRYYISDQRQHTIRAYRNALFVYRENGWSYISDHVHYNVGSHLSLATQNVFLNEFSHVVQAVDSGGNAAKAGLRAGDQVLYTSNFFGDELWPADKLGFTKTTIQAKPDSVYFVVNRGAEVDVKRLTKRTAPARFGRTLTEAQKAS